MIYAIIRKGNKILVITDPPHFSVQTGDQQNGTFLISEGGDSND